MISHFSTEMDWLASAGGFEARRKALIELIRTAMGKTVGQAEEWIEPLGEPIRR